MLMVMMMLIDLQLLRRFPMKRECMLHCSSFELITPFYSELQYMIIPPYRYM